MRDKKISSTCLRIILILSIIGFLGNESSFSSRLDITTRNSSALTHSNATAPEIDIATWTLSINGSVSTPLNLTYNELKALPAVTIFAELMKGMHNVFNSISNINNLKIFIKYI